MYNDFIAIIKENLAKKRWIIDDYAINISGYDVIRENGEWKMEIIRLPLRESNDYTKISGWNTNAITNKFPKEVAANVGSLDHEEPYLFIPKGKIYNIPIEYPKDDYETPESEDELLKKGISKQSINILKKDKVHGWRMITGCELIHKENTIAEQEKLWINWQKMGDYSKNLSDNRSIELFGMTNEEHHNEIINNKYWKKTPLYSEKEINIKKFLNSEEILEDKYWV
jgi:hypothetical protein